MNNIFYQTEIKEYGKFAPVLESIGNYGCLAMCYLWTVGIEPLNAPSMAEYLSDAMLNGLLDKECTVLDADRFLLFFTGKKYRVQKKQISSIKTIKKATPVRYDYEGKSHWVVVEDGKIIFNSLINSVCVSKGTPTTAREINLC